MSIFPLAPLFIFLSGIFSTVVIGYGFYYVNGWFNGTTIFTSLLLVGIGMLVFSLLGRYFILLLLARPGRDEPKTERSGEVERICQADGTEIHVEFYGPTDGQPVIFTHGWSADSNHWYYVKESLGDRFRLIIWDIPGAGKSGKVPNGDYSMDKLATCLAAVVDLVKHKPAIVFGHSMGGMILLTFCRLFPNYLGEKVCAIGLVNTTPTNPVHTAPGKNILRVLQKPLLEPLLYLMMGLYPIVWLQTWMSFLNGTSHIFARFSCFAGKQTLGQLDFAVYLSALISPVVLARQMLGMMHYDAIEVLTQIQVPTLIVSANIDRATQTEASRFMNEQIEGSELVVLATSGHISMMEQHGQFVETIANFIDHSTQRLNLTKVSN
jgi:pimeloyl-ACP methyl ester carboxylesterase